jgi:Asp-tRNA(Asn)/Glu-tRNA(Gln) amidotransferase A subunit family amidase
MKMNQTELAICSLAELAELLHGRGVSPVEVARVMIERTERLDPTLGTYITFTAEAALEDARRAEREILAGEHRGPLHGVPVAVKDMLWTAGVRTTFGSRAFAGSCRRRTRPRSCDGFRAFAGPVASCSTSLASTNDEGTTRTSRP